MPLLRLVRHSGVLHCAAREAHRIRESRNGIKYDLVMVGIETGAKRGF